MFNRSELNNVLQDTRSGLSDIFGDKLEEVILYGSYARGDETIESDIDVMAVVKLSKEQIISYRRLVSDFSSTLDLRYGVFLSIKLQDSESLHKYRNTLPFFMNVLREGINVV